ncbi:ATP-binding cassette domain-containing protein [Enterococcus faecium]|uniref:ATP-binding cassette domain-containing protein n=1 Tax=Enterococcus faecium TaxID=1352 RepID=UPI0024140BB1|nr:ATP-binding cassette domain-containing protein [Enterococcus faecium]MDG4589190.1 ATP-binding cassette domain-containing protein [Enterococcus faecium]
MSILSIKDVYYRYEGSTQDILKKINIQFDNGRIYGIIGKSGSGKSTLLSLLSGLDLCTSGEIQYLGNNMSTLDRDKYRCKNIGVVFQSYNLLTNATVLDNILLSMNISGVDVRDKKEYAYQLLNSVGITNEQANRKVLRLSGGEQQRVGIARALSHDPDVIIADEPTGNLDPETEASIMEILMKLAHKEDKCVIIVTHSKSVAKYVDELYALANGKLLFVRSGTDNRT